MSEVYWLGGALPQDWEAQAARLGIRPAWIDEAHWCGLPVQPAWIAHPPSFNWPENTALQARLLQDCARSLLTGERSLALLAAPEGACLLASPRAVGRLNLLPATRLAAWGALPAGSGWEALAQATGLPVPIPFGKGNSRTGKPALVSADQERISGNWQILFPPPAPAAEELSAEAAQAVQLPAGLLERCAVLRQEITDPNDLLWRLLENRQINQTEFSRGQELDGQVLDFFCPQAGLVVLIDHRADIEDAYRMHVFTQHGLRVLRFWNSQVIEDTPEVLQAIWAAVSGGGGAPTPPPSSVPSPTPAPETDCKVLPSPGGIAGLNALCAPLKPGWRGLLADGLPGQPVMFLVVEGI